MGDLVRASSCCGSGNPDGVGVNLGVIISSEDVLAGRCLMAVWLVGYLAGWLFGWVVWLVGLVACWSVCVCLVVCLVVWFGLFVRLVGWSVG